MWNLRKFILHNEAVVGIRAPSDYDYLKILGFILGTVASWPNKEIGQHESMILTTILKCTCLALSFSWEVGETVFIVSHCRILSFLELGHLYIAVLMNAVSLSRITTLTFSAEYRDVAKEFLMKMHLFYYKDNSEFAMKIHKKVHFISHLFTLGLTCQMLLGLTLYNAIPMYSNYSSGRYKPGGTQNSTFEHSVYISYPFNTSTDMNGYIFACIHNWLISYMVSTWFCMFDLLLSLMVFHLWGHFKILVHNLNNFPRPFSKSSIILEDGTTISAEMFSKDEQQNVSDKLTECINYHREIIKFTNRMSSVFGPMLFVYYMFHQASGCLLLLECSEMTTQALVRYVPLTIILFQQLIQLSVIFELVGSESEKLKDAVYGVPWECMDTKNRKTVAFFLMNVQEPVHVKAMGLANVGVTTMAAILRTTMSYFTFLRSM